MKLTRVLLVSVTFFLTLVVPRLNGAPTVTLESAILPEATFVAEIFQMPKQDSMLQRLLDGIAKSDENLASLLKFRDTLKLYSNSQILFTAIEPPKDILERDAFFEAEFCVAITSQLNLDPIFKKFTANGSKKFNLSLPSNNNVEFTIKPVASIEGLTTYAIQGNNIKSVLMGLVLAEDGKTMLLAPISVLKKQLKSQKKTSLPSAYVECRKNLAGKGNGLVFSSITPQIREELAKLTKELPMLGSVFTVNEGMGFAFQTNADSVTLSFIGMWASEALAQTTYAGGFQPLVMMAPMLAAASQITLPCLKTLKCVLNGKAITTSLTLTEEDLQILRKLFIDSTNDESEDDVEVEIQ